MSKEPAVCSKIFTYNADVPKETSGSFLGLSRDISERVEDTGGCPDGASDCSRQRIFDCRDQCPA
jgi:hypothetical protein